MSQRCANHAAPLLSSSLYTECSVLGTYDIIYLSALHCHRLGAAALLGCCTAFLCSKHLFGAKSCDDARICSILTHPRIG